MEYVTLGKTGLEVSRFGLGCMRFPASEEDSIEMVRYALDNGVNYIDTAYVYKNSEERVGRALQDGYREKAVLVTKSPVWLAESQEDLENFLDNELTRLQTDCIDIYLLHDLNISNWEYVKQYEAFEFMECMKEKGKIKHIAGSFHGTYDHFQTVLHAYPWEMIQIQLNIMDTKHQAGIQGLKDAASMNIPVVIMEPLRGGTMLKYAPSKVNQLVKNYPEQRLLVEWAFRFLYNMPEVSVILSGTNTLEQLKENIMIFENSRSNVMSMRDMEFMKKIQKAYAERYVVPCTRCGYCLPCPVDVNIPEIFSHYNMKMMTRHWVDTYFYTKNLVTTKTDASRCVACGQCEERCPQDIKIIEMLKLAHKELI
jgi:predicted aldo/keto reductase-like oxidoreductase